MVAAGGPTRPPPGGPPDHSPALAPKARHVSDSNFGPPPGNFNGDDSGAPRRAETVALPPTRRPLVTALVVASALLVVIAIAAQFWTEVLWYQSVDFAGVFSTQLLTKLVLGVFGGLLTAAMTERCTRAPWVERILLPATMPP